MLCISTFFSWTDLTQVYPLHWSFPRIKPLLLLSKTTSWFNFTGCCHFSRILGGGRKREKWIYSANCLESQHGSPAQWVSRWIKTGLSPCPHRHAAVWLSDRMLFWHTLTHSVYQSSDICPQLHARLWGLVPQGILLLLGPLAASSTAIILPTRVCSELWFQIKIWKNDLQSKAGTTEDSFISSQASGPFLQCVREQASLLQRGLQGIQVPVGVSVEERTGQILTKPVSDLPSLSVWPWANDFIPLARTSSSVKWGLHHLSWRVTLRNGGK